jgi:hypothetical protein
MLTHEEKQRFADAAQEEGLSMSDWVRLSLRASSARKEGKRESRTPRLK